MTEWGVVTIIIALIGLGVTVGKPILSLNTAIVKLTAAVDGLKEDSRQLRSDVANFEENNHKSHQRLHERIDNNEARLTKLEHK